MDNKETNKNQNFCDYLILDVEEFFDMLKKKIASAIKSAEKKEREYESIWKFINNFKVRDTFSEEFKIILAVVFTIVSAVWINNRGAVYIAHSDDSEITNAQTKAIDINVKEVEEKDSSEKKTDIKSAVGYKLESSEESCERDKEQKKSSDLCGEDDKEIVEKIAKEKESEDRENKVRLINSKPRVVRLSCRESNYGHPSESDTKGKHVDEDCCPDPDEWPKPGCVYDAKGYSIMLSRSVAKK